MGFDGVKNHSVKKSDNGRAAFGAKVDIRRRVFAAIPAPVVFDGFAGSGRMFEAVWRDAADYVGCDRKDYSAPGKTIFVCDSARLLRAIDLERFTIFDFDAYGSPWDHVAILAARRRVAPGEIIGLVLTDGGALGAKLNSPPRSLLTLSGTRPGLSGYNRIYADMTTRAIAGAAARMRCEVVKRWQAKGVTGQSMFYSGVVLRGIPEQAPRRAKRRPSR